MKRILTTTALAVLMGSLAFSGAAQAQGWHDRGHDHGRYERGDDRDWHDRDRDRDRGHYDNGWHGRGHYDNGHHYGWRERSEWRRGGYVGRYDWDRGRYIDYRYYHLRRPPYGYEWREVNGNYVLAAVASGLIVSLIMNQ